jgi:hypothetical protein
MNERYVISIKAFKDVTGRPCEEWRYAGIDNGTYGSGYPCWCYSEHSGKSFYSVEDARKWFNECKQYLFGTYYNRNDFDMATLAIRKVVYKKEVSLTV